jgi:transcription elongation factor Elf1
MWLFVGTGEDFKPVPGGQKIERDCDRCGQRTMFYEREVTQTVKVYFVKVFAHSPRNVMACGACGASFATGESAASFRDVQQGTVVGAVGDLADKAKAAIDDGKIEEVGAKALESAKESLDSAKDTVIGWMNRRRK